MTNKSKKRLAHALHIAAEMIRGHGEVGLAPEDIGEEDEEGLQEYIKATKRASKLITTLARKYEK